MEQTCERVHREEMASVVIRTRCSVDQLPNVIGPAYQRIGAYLGARGIEPAGPPYVGYHNEDMQDLEIEIGFPIAEVIKPEGEFEEGSIPAGEYASTLHVGPYSDFEQAYARLSTWLEEQAIESTGACYEIYLNDPANTPEQALQTLILFPLKD